jgi:hypothetical protein
MLPLLLQGLHSSFWTLLLALVGSTYGFGLRFSSVHANVHDYSGSCYCVSDYFTRFDHVVLVGEVEDSIADVQKVKQFQGFALCLPILS